MEIRKTPKKISAIVIAKNEEEKLADCLSSISSWVIEIILVDTGSTDKTIEIAKKFGAKVSSYEGGSYNNWRNEGLSRSSGEWVLYVDADERVTPDLRNEILNLISKVKSQKTDIVAYAIPRRNVVLGKELKYGGWWPDYVKRLYFKKYLKGWKGELHEEPDYEGKMGYLKKPLMHIKEDKLSDMVDKTNRWSDIEARLMFEADHPKMNVLRFVTAMFREFWLRMIKNLAFLDGGVGIIFALYQVYSKFVSYAKLWELQITKKS